MRRCRRWTPSHPPAGVDGDPPTLALHSGENILPRLILHFPCWELICITRRKARQSCPTSTMQVSTRVRCRCCSSSSASACKLDAQARESRVSGPHTRRGAVRAAASLCLTLYDAPTLRRFGTFAVWIRTQFAVKMLTVHRRFAGARLDGAVDFVPGRRQPDDQRPEERLAAGAPAPLGAFASCRRQTRRYAPLNPVWSLSAAFSAVTGPVNVLRVRPLRPHRVGSCVCAASALSVQCCSGALCPLQVARCVNESV